MRVLVVTSRLTNREIGEMNDLGINLSHSLSANETQPGFYLDGPVESLNKFFRDRGYRFIASTADSYWSDGR